MKISFYTIPGNLRKDTGYGYAGYNMVLNLQKLGHEVPYDDKSAKVQICFSQPNWYNFHSGQYRIGYTPWESTELPSEWYPKITEVDELWTPAEWIADVYRDLGVADVVRVYRHGIDPIFRPRLREPKQKLRFLHVGEPAPRKGGQFALDAFRAAFGNRDDVHLTIKAFLENRTRAYAGTTIIGPPDIFNNVSLSVGSMPTEQLVSLYHSHDVLVYPSWGEGFGLIPLEAMATGMPAIVTQGWAPYEKHVLPIKSTLGRSPWQHMHPGNMWEPDFDDLVEWYRDVYHSYDAYSKSAYESAHIIHREYDWQRLTRNSFEHIVQKFG